MTQLAINTMPVDWEIPGFREYLRDRNYAANSVRMYPRHIELFVNWLFDRSIKSPSEVTPAIVQSYGRHLQRRTARHKQHRLKATTRRRHFSSLNCYFRWARRRKKIEINPMDDVRFPKAEKVLPRALTIDEVESILALPKVSTMTGLRDRAILEFFYSTAARINEVRTMLLQDVDIDDGVALIRHGKGKKERWVPIGERALYWLRKYLEEVWPLQEKQYGDQHLFLDGKGRQFQPSVLSHLVTYYIQRSDVTTQGGAHLFRHSCATHMVENGADIRFVQALLGHSRISSTQIYTKVQVGKLSETLRSTHPSETGELDDI